MCRLPVSRYQWEVEVTTVSGGTGSSGSSIRATLPGGDATINVSLSSSRGRGAASNAAGSIATRSAPQGDQLRVTVNGSASGPLTASGDRAQIQNGSLNGSITLTDGSRPPTVLGTCTAADHRFSLVPR